LLINMYSLHSTLIYRMTAAVMATNTSIKWYRGSNSQIITQRHGAWVVLTPSSSRSDWTKMTSAVAFTADLYSASVLNRETVACFFAL
jgi:hypothetical protein